MAYRSFEEPQSFDIDDFWQAALRRSYPDEFGSGYSVPPNRALVPVYDSYPYGGLREYRGFQTVPPDPPERIPIVPPIDHSGEVELAQRFGNVFYGLLVAAFIIIVFNALVSGADSRVYFDVFTFAQETSDLGSDTLPALNPFEHNAFTMMRNVFNLFANIDSLDDFFNLFPNLIDLMSDEIVPTIDLLDYFDVTKYVVDIPADEVWHIESYDTSRFGGF